MNTNFRGWIVGWLRGSLGRAMKAVTEQAVIPEREWREMAAAHRARAERWTLPAKRRRAAHRAHPVEDFLFTYYPFSFAKLEEWHPPVGVALEAGGELPECWKKSPYRREAGVVMADPALLSDKERARLRWICELLAATQARTPVYSCHGLHEWAMVYRGTEVRHVASTRLRLPQAEIDTLVESRPVRCSHFDAFRFFHPEALSLNRLQPTLMERQDFEQPGCVHANMDLYKWAFKSMPWGGTELLMDCFELAMALRDLDMRASPYDLAAYGLEPVRIETAEGRREYESAQAELAARAVPVRERLIRALGAALPDR